MLSFAFRNSPSPIIKVFSPRSIWSSRCDRDGQADTHRHNAGFPGRFGISQATAYRYLDEAITVLAARAPALRQALERAREDGLP